MAMNKELKYKYTAKIDSWDRENELADIHDWCEFHFGERQNQNIERWTLNWGTPTLTLDYKFKYKEDYILFKLTWL